MNVLVTGELTFIGKRVVKNLLEKNHDVYILTPNLKDAQKMYGESVRYIHWESYLHEPFLSGLEIDAIIHLAGNILKPKSWSNEYKKIVYNSRVDSTRSLLRAICNLQELPKSFVTSCLDIDKEQFNLRDGKFLQKVYEDWKDVVAEFKGLSTRLVTIKPTLVLSKESGLIKSIISLMNGAMATHWGSGKQTVSWIHVDDLANMYRVVIEDDFYDGDLKASSPYNVSNTEFLKTLSETMGKKSFIKVPKFYLSYKMGVMAPVLLSSKDIHPEKFLERRFLYLYPTIEMAIKEVLSQNARPY
jgi:uncharacterized protein (TIGR01777 family)